MDVSAFEFLIEGLRRPRAYPHAVGRVEHIETHISHVFLAGPYAYKLKKPVNLGFLDFSTLERRHRFCEEELRLNRRLAPELYLDVVPITGTSAEPRLGGAGEALEWAVRMRRFPQSALLARQHLTPELIDRLAEQVADFHGQIPIAAPDAPYGSAAAVLAPMLENLSEIGARLGATATPERLARIETWTRARWSESLVLIEQRRRRGAVRECHGDMHRGNIALVDGRLQIFDAIEFNPTLRWIDTASEIAFLLMDLEQAGDWALARRFLNRYLERRGDYEALRLLDFYKVYRAMVRAKVLAIRLGQADCTPEEASADRLQYEHYLSLAESYTERRRPRLMIACGLSGSGKSRLAAQLREALPLVHLRSDIERKRLFGLHEKARTLTHLDAGIYFPSATDWTYERLYHLTDVILASGHDVLVDATFTSRARRGAFAALARRHGAGFVILALDAPASVLRQRIERRLARGEDASEANLEVLEHQIRRHEPLTETERASAILIDSSRAPALDVVVRRIEVALKARSA